MNLAAEGSTGAGAGTAALVASIHDAFIVAAAICSIGIVTSLVRGGGTREQGHAKDAVPAR